jgi:hypothetical protein
MKKLMPLAIAVSLLSMGCVDKPQPVAHHAMKPSPKQILKQRFLAKHFRELAQ